MAEQDWVGSMPDYVFVVLADYCGRFICSETNPTAAKDIMGNVTNYLKSQPVRYGRSSIISGIQEAIDGWIAVNYLKHDVRLQHMLGSNGYPVM
jgi:hypothetical protein